MKYYRARHMGGGVLHLFEYHSTEEACLEFCAARKEQLQTGVDFFCVAIREEVEFA